MTKLTTSFLMLAAALAFCQPGHAQGFANAQVNQIRGGTSAAAFSADRFRNQILSRSYGRFGVAGVNARSFGLSSNQNPNRQKPFQGLNRGPSVSPYLSLSGSLNSANDFYNLVRPQQDFQRAQRQRERDNLQAQRAQQARLANEHRLNQMSASPPFDITGDKTTMPTGHGTSYLNMTQFQTTGAYFGPVQGLNKQVR